MKKFVKLCLHASYKSQNFWHFDDFFHKNFNLNFGLCETLKRLLAEILGYFETIFDFPTQFDVVEMHFKMYSRNILSYWEIDMRSKRKWD